VGANSHSAQKTFSHFYFQKGSRAIKAVFACLWSFQFFDLLNPECAKQVFSLLQVGAWSKKVSV
jgi:hypothetical protein